MSATSGQKLCAPSFSAFFAEKDGITAVLIALFLFSALCAHAQTDRGYWNKYAARFISNDGRVIDPDRDAMTTSEGQSYAMFFALVANDSAKFELLRGWTERNLAKGNLSQNLPAWSWGRKSNGSWETLDENPAADADLWLAYDLIQAGALWKNPGYMQTGRALLALIAKDEVGWIPGVGPLLMPGRIELFAQNGRYVLNPSYMPLPLLLAAAKAAPGGPWRQMAAALPGWLAKVSPGGIAMDWVAYDNKSGFASAADPSDSKKTPRGSYDAIRVYLWAGMTAKKSPGAAGILAVFAPMAKLMQSNPAPPEIIGPDGKTESTAAPLGFSAAMSPFLASSGAQAAATAQLRLALAQYDQQTGLLGTPPRYYDQNLALFAVGWQDQRFQFATDGTLKVKWK